MHCALDELRWKVRGYINSIDGFKVEDIEFIFTVYGDDHGCGKYRFVTKLIIDMKDGLAEIDCKKDSGEVLKKTIGENIINGINTVENCALRFVYDEEKKEWDALILRCLLRE